MVAVSAAVLPHAQTVAHLKNVVYYACANCLCAWNTETENVAWIGSVDADITAVVIADKNVVFSSHNGSIHVYNADSKELTVFDTLPSSVSCLAYHERLVAGCMDGNTYIYSGLDAKMRQNIKNKGYTLAAATYKQFIVVGGTGIQLQVIDAETLEHVFVDGHENWVRDLDIKVLESKESKSEQIVFASASQEKCIRLYTVTMNCDVVNDDFFSTIIKLNKFSIEFEALLIGHDDWVVAVQWHPTKPALVSASADSSLIVWEESVAGDYFPASRYGDVSIWGASSTTGTSGGFWSCLVTDSLKLVTSTHTGSFRVWDNNGDAVCGPTGHFKTLTDCQWLLPNLLLTTSLDQTTRLWECSNGQVREIGRPQVHGYDMKCVCKVTSTCFASGGDEKVVRVFDMPVQVAEQLESSHFVENGAINLSSLPQIAGTPALGLSNKPEEGLSVVLGENPREDQLQRLSLWPETEKLYGHGYEIGALACTSKYLMSVCGANTAQHAGIRFYDINAWRELKPPVMGHNSSVTRLAVSPDEKYLLSTSKDRSYMLINVETREICVRREKAHTRILYDGCFVSNEQFVTCSRDKSVKLWSLEGEELAVATTTASASAIAANESLIAVGDEEGAIVLFDHSLKMVKRLQMPGRVNRLAFNGNSLAAVSCMLMVFPVDKQ